VHQRLLGDVWAVWPRSPRKETPQDVTGFVAARDDIDVDDRQHEVRTDRGGNIDVVVEAGPTVSAQRRPRRFGGDAIVSEPRTSTCSSPLRGTQQAGRASAGYDVTVLGVGAPVEHASRC
jgi:hypothetical protein